MLLPHTSDSLKTDDEKPLSLALFNPAQLERHAKAVAVRHVVDRKRRKNSLLHRLKSNERVLEMAYERLNCCVQRKQQISPAGEWLLDNFYVIEEQIATARRHFPNGYSRALPHLVSAQSFGNPRVYDIALEVIAHVDGRVDEENMTNFLAAYQRVTFLKIGEFWAIPIMLRLALIENLRRVAHRVLTAIEERDLARHWAQVMLDAAEVSPNELILVTADMARSLPVLSNAFIAEFVRLLQGRGKVFDIPLTWMEHQLEDEERSTQNSVHFEAQQQAANQVSVSASIGSLRFLDAMNWPTFIESLSEIELELAKDPANFYKRMDFKTRDSYRHVVEDIAKRTSKPEIEIAMAAMQRAQEHPQTPIGIIHPEMHVGYYLLDKGVSRLKQSVGDRSWTANTSEISDHSRAVAYVTSIGLITASLTFPIFLLLSRHVHNSTAIWAVIILCMVTCSQVAIALINWFVTAFFKPKNFPKLDFSEGVPNEYRTLVVVPTLLVNENNIDSLLEELEIRYLANRSENIYFGLLTDFTDADVEHVSSDNLLCQRISSGVSSLNEKYSVGRVDVFFLFHRPRLWSQNQSKWMGSERKRGKLSALNRLLRNKAISAAGRSLDFSLIVGNLDHLTDVKYVITLDTDTKLPRDAATKLIAAMAHPLNRACYDHDLGRVSKGYGILQPRVAVSLPGSRRSLYVRIFCSDPGIDPYTNAVSDVYQDLFQEGSFVGKGIYDIDAFQMCLEGRLPDDLILSHDLLEGCLARCGLVTDVLFYEEHPHHFGEEAKRRKRWIRGDWQIFYWLLPWVPTAHSAWTRNSISLLSKWKIFDNLRRSVVS
ncbi:MAG: cyclic beta 1-2 glucan synthetase, partial [Proteobacteria bacterium]|nr:cyclic beta 1-2 glucan synthetase [Pseudomonadota bacterium]